MKNKTSRFNRGKIILLVTYIFVVLRAMSHFKITDESSFINGVGFGVLIALIVFFIEDIYKNNVYNKGFWAISIVFLPLISAPIYLIQRDKLIRLGSKFNRR
jgi:hypothetical protein